MKVYKINIRDYFRTERSYDVLTTEKSRSVSTLRLESVFPL